MKKQQTGSAHVIITVVLAVALLGALGFIFYQNFIAKKSQVATGTASSTSAQTLDQASTAQVTPTQLTDFCTKNEKVCFQYNSSNWSLVDSSGKLSFPLDNTDMQDRIVLNSKDSSVKLVFLNAISGLGGACDGSIAKDSLETVTAYKTNLAIGQTTDYMGEAVYAIKAVNYDGNGGYYPVMGLTNTLSYEAIGQHGPCIMYPSLVQTKSNYSLQFSNIGFDETTASTRPAKFSTRADAAAKLNSDTYNQAYEILKTVKVK